MRTAIYLTAAILAAQVKTVAADPLGDLAASAGTDADKLILAGDLYVEAGRLAEAKKMYKQAAWKNKNNPEAKLGLIRLSMAEGKFQQTKYYCRKLTQSDPSSSAGDICSGRFWLGNDRSSRAVEEFEKAVAKGDKIRGKTGIGDALSLVGKWDDAVLAYKEAIDAGASYEAHMGLGLTLEKKGDVKGATPALQQAVTAQNASSLAHYHLGRLLGQGDAAVAELKTACEIRPKWFDGLFELASSYQKNKNYDAAIDAYKQAIAVDDNRAPSYFGLAQSLRAEKRNDEALDALQQVVDKLPNHAGAYLLFAEIFWEQKKTDQAIESLDRARAVASGDVFVFIRSAEIYYDAGRHTNARAFLNQALSMNPKLSKAHEMLGDIACERKQFDEGQKNYTDALKGDLVDVDKAAIEKKKTACKK
jgi:tetratricopeptide (TPR) repeat protein